MLRTAEHVATLGEAPPGSMSGGVQVLRDVIDVAEHSVHDGPGPHVTTGPIAVRGAQPGDVLTVEVLGLQLRVPYGVISNREGKGALPGECPEKFRGDPANTPYFNEGGNISVFAPVERGRGTLPGDVAVRFDLAPFMGISG